MIPKVIKKIIENKVNEKVDETLEEIAETEKKLEEDEKMIDEIEKHKEEPKELEVVEIKSKYDSESKVLLVSCVDPRFSDDFRKFTRDKFGNFVHLSIPGGIGALVLPDLMPKPFKVLKQQIKFIVNGMDIEKIILISHDDCKWYKHNKGYFRGLQPEQQKLDITSAKKIIEEEYDIQVECIHAGLKNGKVVFVS